MKKSNFICLALACLTLASCGGGGAETTASIGGTVRGLGGPTLLLTNNGGDLITIEGDGSFTFPKRVTEGNTYGVAVFDAPNGVYCRVDKSSGTVGHEVDAITDVAITCMPGGASTPAGIFRVAVTVSGLLPGRSVTLDNGGEDTLTVDENGLSLFPFVYSSARFFAGTAGGYDVSVKTQPTRQTCTVTGGSGAVTGWDPNLVDIPVVCQ